MQLFLILRKYIIDLLTYNKNLRCIYKVVLRHLYRQVNNFLNLLSVFVKRGVYVGLNWTLSGPKLFKQTFDVKSLLSNVLDSKIRCTIWRFRLPSIRTKNTVWLFLVARWRNRKIRLHEKWEWPIASEILYLSRAYWGREDERNFRHVKQEAISTTYNRER